MQASGGYALPYGQPQTMPQYNQMGQGPMMSKSYSQGKQHSGMGGGGKRNMKANSMQNNHG